MDIKEKALLFKDTFYLLAIQNSLKNAKTVLDVGSGEHSPLGKIKSKFYSTGIDIFKKCIQISKKEKNHNEYVLGDIRNLKKYFKQKSFDTVISLDVIEHLSRKEGFEMIKQMEQVARKRVIIMTPNGFYPQDTLFGNPHQVHKSGWYVKDFQKLGYRVYGLRGLKFIRGVHATIKHEPWLFWGIIAFITEPLLYFFPLLAYDIYAVKDLK